MPRLALPSLARPILAVPRPAAPGHAPQRRAAPLHTLYVIVMTSQWYLYVAFHASYGYTCRCGRDILCPDKWWTMPHNSELLEMGTRDSKPKKVEIRVTEEWFALVDEAAKRKGLGLSAYIRMVVLERMQQDQISVPPRKKK